MAHKLLVLTPLLAAALVASLSEVVPGPGLPSLSELGVTSSDLYGPPAALPSKSNEKYKRDFPTCNTFDDLGPVDINDAIACFNYLVLLGNYQCPANNSVVCTYGQADVKVYKEAQITPQLYAALPSTIDCWDVALGVQKIFTECNINGNTSGNAWVGENKAYQVDLLSKDVPTVTVGGDILKLD